MVEVDSRDGYPSRVAGRQVSHDITKGNCWRSLNWPFLVWRSLNWPSLDVLSLDKPLLNEPIREQRGRIGHR